MSRNLALKESLSTFASHNIQTGFTLAVRFYRLFAEAGLVPVSSNNSRCGKEITSKSWRSTSGSSMVAMVMKCFMLRQQVKYIIKKQLLALLMRYFLLLTFRSRAYRPSSIEIWPSSPNGNRKPRWAMPGPNLLATRLSGQCQFGLYALPSMGHSASVLQHDFRHFDHTCDSQGRWSGKRNGQSVVGHRDVGAEGGCWSLWTDFVRMGEGQWAGHRLKEVAYSGWCAKRPGDVCGDICVATFSGPFIVRAECNDYAKGAGGSDR